MDLTANRDGGSRFDCRGGTAAGVGSLLVPAGDSQRMITFARKAYNEVICAAYDGHEEEVCGLLAGEFEAAETRVEAVYPAENAADRPEIRYYIDPEEQLELIESIEDEGLEVAGFYHSHPAGPIVWYGIGIGHPQTVSRSTRLVSVTESTKRGARFEFTEVD